jgi:predicted HicB family RNase H-like nuclease
VRISSELHREAAMAASLKNMSLNDFVKNAIHFTLSKLNKDSSIDFSSGLI